MADALAEPSAAAARERVERATAGHDYAGFELVLADADDAVLLSWDGDLRATPLAPGVTVVVNVGVALPDGGLFREPAGAVGAERWRVQADAARRLRERLAPQPGERSGEWLDRAGATLGDHDAGVCVHGDGFGTRSSSLLRVDGARAYRFADGPPCEAGYRVVDEQV